MNIRVEMPPPPEDARVLFLHPNELRAAFRDDLIRQTPEGRVWITFIPSMWVQVVRSIPT